MLNRRGGERGRNSLFPVRMEKNAGRNIGSSMAVVKVSA
jgi:hypothetical protein